MESRETVEIVTQKLGVNQDEGRGIRENQRDCSIVTYL